MTHGFRRSITRSDPFKEVNRTGLAITYGSEVRSFLCIILLPFLFAQSCSVPASRDFVLDGAKANALLCRPEGKGPFPAIIWSHGRVTDAAVLERASTGGWPRLCQAFASDGFLAFVPIREFERGAGPHNLRHNEAELSQAVDYVKGLPDVDPSRLALMGHSRGGLLTLMLGLERKDLKALIITAPADIRPYFAQSLARSVTDHRPCTPLSRRR
jgi:dipeptidyl aminopeptidase/acylaminoacyl peptidase